MANTTSAATTSGTVYYPNGRDAAPVTLKRDAVVQYRDQAYADAVKYERGELSRTDREFGWTAADAYRYARARRGEGDRLTKVLAAIDAGLPELPAELEPESARR